MTLTEKKAKLREYGINEEDWFVVKKDDKTNIILYRGAVQRVEETIEAEIELLSGWGDTHSAGMIGKGRIPSDNSHLARISVLTWGIWTYMSASASAENTESLHNHYAEIAEKRLRHRLVLTLAGLYQHDIFSIEESNSFEPTPQINDKGIYDELNKIREKKEDRRTPVVPGNME